MDSLVSVVVANLLVKFFEELALKTPPPSHNCGSGTYM